MENKDWLNSLKVGDEVFVRYNYDGSLCLSEVERITPTRQIVVNGMRFKDGRCAYSRYYANFLEEATPDKIRKYKEDKFVQEVAKNLRNLKEITYEQAKAIAEVFGWCIFTE